MPVTHLRMVDNVSHHIPYVRPLVNHPHGSLPVSIQTNFVEMILQSVCRGGSPVGFRQTLPLSA